MQILGEFLPELVEWRQNRQLMGKHICPFRFQFNALRFVFQCRSLGDVYSFESAFCIERCCAPVRGQG